MCTKGQRAVDHFVLVYSLTLIELLLGDENARKRIFTFSFPVTLTFERYNLKFAPLSMQRSAELGVSTALLFREH